jgi:DNA-binding MarR family transcriptional regulator
MVDVNGFELYVLGRRLMRLGRQATPQAGIHRLPTSVQLVLVDVSEHPASSVSEVVTRTGLPQSLVSAAVARLREGKAVVTDADPADRRRTLVSVSPDIPARTAQVPTTPLEEVLGPALGIADPDEVAELVRTLSALAARFEGATHDPDPGTRPGATTEG